jgi:hypothetical protein
VSLLFFSVRWSSIFTKEGCQIFPIRSERLRLWSNGSNKEWRIRRPWCRLLDISLHWRATVLPLFTNGALIFFTIPGSTRYYH